MKMDGIRMTLRWFFFSCKRAMKKPFFLLLLVLLPLCMSQFRRAESRDDGKIAVALFTDGNAWNETVANRLTEGEHSFSFYRCESRERLAEDVAAGRAECGYVFPADLRERLESGQYKRAIRVVVSPSTAAAALGTEVVFAGLFEVYGRELLREYAETGAPFAAAGTAPAWEELELLYDAYLTNGSTFAFEYGTMNGGSLKNEGITAVFPVRGICAVFLLVMGLAAAVTAGEDAVRGMFAAVMPRQRLGMQLAEIAAMVIPAEVSVFAALCLSDALRGPVREAAALFCYGVMIILFSAALLAIVRNPLAVAGLIPFFILGSLAACPVFADLSAFVPVLTVIRRFFPPWYYLMM